MPGEKEGAPEVSELDKSADAALLELETAPEGGADPASPTPEATTKKTEAAPIAPVEEADDDKFLEAQAGEIGKSIPKGFYERFRKVNESKKEFEKRVKEYEPKIKEFDQVKGDYTKQRERLQGLIDEVAKHPWLDEALDGLMSGKPINPAELITKLQALVDAAEDPKGGAQVPQEFRDPRVDRLEEIQRQQETRNKIATYQLEYSSEIKQIKNPDGELAKKYKDVISDPTLMEEVYEVAEGLAALNPEKRPSLLPIAERVLARRQKLISNVLAKQVKAAPAKDAAALERSSGAAGDAKKNQPAFGSREWDAWAMSPEGMTELTTAD